MQICKSLAPAFITCFLDTILNATMFAVFFAMTARSKVYVLCFLSEGEDAYMIDPRPIEDWCKDTPALMYARYTLGFTLQYTDVVNVHISGWNEDVFK